MATSYTGPTVSPVFVAGVINDAWDQAVILTARARAAVDGLNPDPATVLDLSPLEAPDDFDVQLPPIVPSDDDAADDLAAQLASMLSTFIGAHFPAVDTPDAAAAWARVAASFTGAAINTAAQVIRARVDSVWAARGFTMPAEAREYQLRAHDLEASRVAAGSLRNNAIILKTHRKSVDLTGYEIVMRTQLEALEAARAFLIGAVLAVMSRQKEEQVMLVKYKEDLQQAFWRHLNARTEANTIELERLILAKRIVLDADLSEEDNRVYAFRQLTQLALDECQSIASQASAAINRVSADASVGGSEKTP